MNTCLQCGLRCDTTSHLCYPPMAPWPSEAAVTRALELAAYNRGRAEGAAAERARWVLFLGLLDAALPLHPYEAKQAIAKKLREVADGGEGGG